VVLPRSADWRAEQILVFEATNEGDSMANLHLMFASADREVRVRIGLFPGFPTKLAIPLAVAGGATLFLDRTPGRFKATVGGANLPFEELREIRFEAGAAAQDWIAIGAIELTDAPPADYPLPAEPLVDVLHQWRQRDWPGKAVSLAAVRAELASELAAPEPEWPTDWSAYGGWTRRRFEAKGWFRTEHDGARWWLVDPEGCAFWSAGVDCVRSQQEVNANGLESLFDPQLPTREAAPELWAGRGFDALAHNLSRTLPGDWQASWRELTRRRLKRFGFNTIGNWSDRHLQRTAGLPYVFTMGGFPTTSQPLFRDFPDVYAPEYAANAARFAAQLADLREDRCVLGYFMTNEPKWAFLQDFDLGRQLLLDARPSATRDAFVLFLQERYPTIDDLNRVWGTALPDWPALAGPVELRGHPDSSADTMAFTAQAVAQYVVCPAAACRAVDPHHLNLGLRWAWIHHDYQLAGCEALDLCSINCYQLKPPAESIASLAAKTGKPVMIGEWHIGALDRGLPSGGIRNCATMAESVAGYRYYLEQAAALPELVGAHYFQWTDQHVLGRFDGENMQIGLHDITYRPYPEHLAALPDIHARAYRIAAGETAPCDRSRSPCLGAPSAAEPRRRGRTRSRLPERGGSRRGTMSWTAGLWAVLAATGLAAVEVNIGPGDSLEAARDEARRLRADGQAAEVVLRAGRYERTAPLALGPEDSGTVWRASGRAVLSGGQALPLERCGAVTDPAVLARLSPTARQAVRKIDLRAVGVLDYGVIPEVFRGAAPLLELFYNDQPLTLARWPNAGWAEMTDIVARGSVPRDGDTAGQPGTFRYDGDRPGSWAGESEVWLHGYWCFDWYDEALKVGRIDPAARTITFTKPHLYGLGHTAQTPRRWYAFNLLCELDSPGEWYLDRTAGLLYFWPPGPLEGASLEVSVAGEPLLAMTDASQITIQGLTFQATRGKAIAVSGGRQVTIAGCTIRNTGAEGIAVEGGEEHRVVACDLERTGTHGHRLSGGDRRTLTPAGMSPRTTKSATSRGARRPTPRRSMSRAWATSCGTITCTTVRTWHRSVRQRSPDRVQRGRPRGPGDGRCRGVLHGSEPVRARQPAPLQLLA